MTDDVDITAKDLPKVEARKEPGPADSLGISDPSLPTLTPVPPENPTAPVRARNALVLAETKDDLSAVAEAGPPTMTLDDEADALAQAAEPERKAPPVKDLPTAKPPPRAPKKKPVLSAQNDGFEGPSLQSLPKVTGENTQVSPSTFTTVDWVVAGLVTVVALGVALTFCAG